MTPAQQADLRAALQANPACAEPLANRDCAALAAVMSVGRTRPNTELIGVGTVLEVLGLTAGSSFLDVINGVADFRHVKVLVSQSKLKIGSPLAQASVQAMVPSVLTQAQADSLCAVGMEPHPYTVAEIAGAVFNPDGSMK